MTAVAGSVYTAAQFNSNVRDNFLQTAPALASGAGMIFVSTAANTLAARAFETASVATFETGTGTVYGSITTFGPWVSVVTGTQALVGISGQMWNPTASAQAWMSWEVTNASTIPASDTWGIMQGGANPGGAIGNVTLATGLTPGTNQFTCQYRTNAGTATWGYRSIWVMPL